MRLVGTQASFNRNARITQPRKSLPRHTRIRIAQRDDNSRQPSRDDRVRAWRRLPVMRTRLQRHIHGLAARGRTSPVYRLGLRVRPPSWLRPAARQYGFRFFIGNHSADGRIRRDLPQPAPRHAQRNAHHMLIKRGRHGIPA